MLSGWLKTRRAPYYKLILTMSIIFPVGATEPTDKIPSMAFLEYLAELVEVDGKLVGPQDMKIEPNIKEEQKAKQKTEQKTEPKIEPKTDKENSEPKNKIIKQEDNKDV